MLIPNEKYKVTYQNGFEQTKCFVSIEEYEVYKLFKDLEDEDLPKDLRYLIHKVSLICKLVFGEENVLPRYGLMWDAVNSGELKRNINGKEYTWKIEATYLP